jgi:hypothetical protein
LIYAGGVRPPRLALLALLAPLAACVNTDAAVVVEPELLNPTLTVTEGTFGVSLKGSFVLSFHLGPRATGPSKVTLQSFAIVSATQEATIVDLSPFLTADKSEVTVELDSDVDVAVNLDTGNEPQELDKAKLCDPAGVVISGAIKDSLQNRPTPVQSAVIHPICN